MTGKTESKPINSLADGGKTPTTSETPDTTYLCRVLSHIREVTGVGQGPMLGELAGAIKAAMAERERAAKLEAYRDAERVWKSVQHSPAPWMDGRAALRKLAGEGL
jgi:hypothetical protein